MFDFLDNCEEPQCYLYFFNHVSNFHLHFSRDVDHSCKTTANFAMCASIVVMFRIQNPPKSARSFCSLPFRNAKSLDTFDFRSHVHTRFHPHVEYRAITTEITYLKIKLSILKHKSLIFVLTHVDTNARV